jgi:uncharacterized membrane protein YdjX (TVP38/TMEM64 family)
MPTIKRYRTILPVLGIISLLYLVYAYTPIVKYTNQQQLQLLVQAAGAFGPVLFGIFYIIITMLFISAAAFSVLAGTLFGKVLGSTIVIIAATISAQASFFIARYFGSAIYEQLGNRGGLVEQLVRKIQVGIKHNGFTYFFIMRCLFLPYIPASYAAGIVKGSNAWQFFWATLLTNAIFSPAFVYFGESIFKGPKALILPAALIAVVLMVPKIVRRIKG